MPYSSNSEGPWGNGGKNNNDKKSPWGSSDDNTPGNSNNDPRIKGISSSSKDGITTINKGIFTSCKKTNNCAPWSI